MARTTIFTVHWARPGGIGGICAAYSKQSTAEAVACERSCDSGILYAAVTSFVLDEAGTRQAAAWFVDGERQWRTPWPTEGHPALDEPGDAGPGAAVPSQARSTAGVTGE